MGQGVHTWLLVAKEYAQGPAKLGIFIIDTGYLS